MPVQLSHLDEWVEREQAWKLIFRRSDDGISASRYGKKKRPDWELCMADINEGRIQILLLWELSRASRDRMVFAALFAACLENGVRIGIGGRVYDLNDPDDAFDLDLKAILAIRESSVTSKRVTDIVRGLAEEGKPHGRIPYGYYRIYHPATKKCLSQEIDPVSSEIVKEIVNRVLAGEWLQGIANDLNARKIPTPWAYAKLRVGGELPAKPYQWVDRQISRIATDPTIAGFRVHNGKVFKASWEAIVPPEKHEALKAKFAEPGRVTNHGRHGVVHLLTNIAVCGKCGATLIRQKNRGNYSYTCKTGFHVSRHQERTDELVREMAIARLERPDALELFTVHDEAEKDALVLLKTLQDRLDGFREQAADGDMTPESFSFMERRLVPQIEEARKAAEPRHVPEEVLDLIRSGHVRKRWKGLTVPQQRRVIRCLMTVTIMPVPPGLARNNGPARKKDGKMTGRFYPEFVKIDWHHQAPGEETLSD